MPIPDGPSSWASPGRTRSTFRSPFKSAVAKVRAVMPVLVLGPCRKAPLPLPAKLSWSHRSTQSHRGFHRRWYLQQPPKGSSGPGSRAARKKWARPRWRYRRLQSTALSENLTKRPLLRNFLHPLNCEEPTLVTAIRLAMDERHRSGGFERDAEGAGLRLNWAGHGERLDEGVGIPGLSGLSAGDRDRKSTRLNSSPLGISYAVFCLK